MMGSGNPTYSAPHTFMGLPQTLASAGFAIAGIPFDLGTSNRPGTRFGPDAIRRASRMLIDGSHPAHLSTEAPRAWDAGNFSVVHGDIPATLDGITKQAKMFDHLITLGGDHTISLPLLRALRDRLGKPVGLLHLDAHTDTWSDNFGGVPFGHGNPFYHAINEGLIDPTRMIQVGIRSPVSTEVIAWNRKHRIKTYSAMDIHTNWISLEQLARFIRSEMHQRPVYLSIDIDVLDPAFAPGTGTPEVGGLATWQVQHLLRKLINIDFVGMDLVEVSPPYDVSEITALAGATLVWEYLYLLSKR